MKIHVVLFEPTRKVLRHPIFVGANGAYDVQKKVRHGGVFDEVSSAASDHKLQYKHQHDQSEGRYKLHWVPRF